METRILKQWFKGDDLTKHVLHAQANNFYLDPSNVNVSTDDKVKAIYDRLPKGGQFEGLSKEAKLNAIKSTLKDLGKISTIIDRSPLASNFQEEDIPMGLASNQPAPAGPWDENDLIKAKLDLLRAELAENFPPGDPRMDLNYKLDLMRQIIDLESTLMKNTAQDYVDERYIERFKGDIDKITRLKKEFLEKFKTQNFYSVDWFNELNKIRATYEETENYWGIKDKMVAIPPYEKEREALFRGLNNLFDRSGIFRDSNLRETNEFLAGKGRSGYKHAHTYYHLEQTGAKWRAKEALNKMDNLMRKLANGEYNNIGELLTDLKDLQDMMQQTLNAAKQALADLASDHKRETPVAPGVPVDSPDHPTEQSALKGAVSVYAKHLAQIAGLIDQASKL